MAVVSRTYFLDTLRYGVDLTHPDLRRQVDQEHTPLSLLAGLDGNRDGLLSGAEVQRSFRLLDGFDRNGDRLSFVDSGQAAALFRALLSARKEGPYYGELVARMARRIASERGEDYAVEHAPRSPNPLLSGNIRPGHTQLSWLKGVPKCNQFVGDVLFKAGLQMPTFMMPRGGRHYVHAESLPRYRRHFDRICRHEDLRAGDLIVIDLPGAGAATAHLEIVTDMDLRRGTMRTAGAHFDGAYMTEKSLLLGLPWHKALLAAKPDMREGRWELDGKLIYLLRPKRRR